jgi:hypothetical protein
MYIDGHELEHTALTKTFSGHRHASWTSTFCLSMFMSMFMMHVRAHAACPHPCCMPMSMLNFHVCAACPCPSCMPMSLLYVCVPAACSLFCCMFTSLLHVHSHAAWISMLHIRVHVEAASSSPAAQTCTCSRDVDMQQGRRHAAGTQTYGMDVDVQLGNGHAADLSSLTCPSYPVPDALSQMSCPD